MVHLPTLGCFALVLQFICTSLCAVDVQQYEDRLNSLHVQLDCDRNVAEDFLFDLVGYQDLLVEVLYTSENNGEYINAMRRLAPTVNTYAEHLDFAGWLLHPSDACHFSHQGLYLNTFGTGCELSSEERMTCFIAEMESYLSDQESLPFSFDVTRLEAEEVYSFVMLPDGTVMVGQQCDYGQAMKRDVQGRKVPANAYPSHTILAGGPDQEVVTAGELTFYEHAGKRLYFISNRSPQFLPSMQSLEAMRDFLWTQKIDPATVIMVSELSFAKVTFPSDRTQVPLAISPEVSHRIIDLAHKGWVYYESDSRTHEILDKVSKKQSISGEDLDYLHSARASGLRFRASFRLLSQKHKAPSRLSLFCQRFGRMKDALDAGKTETAAAQAVKIQALLKRLDPLAIQSAFVAASADSVIAAIQESLRYLHEKLASPSLTDDEYHEVKKVMRQVYQVLWLRAEAGENFHLYREASRLLHCICHDIGEERDNALTPEVAINPEMLRRYQAVASKMTPQPE